MVRPTRSEETLQAQKRIDEARALLDEPVKENEFSAQELTTHGGRKASLPEIVVGSVEEQARSFKNEYLRLVWLLAIVLVCSGVFVWMLHSGLLKLGR